MVATVIMAVRERSKISKRSIRERLILLKSAGAVHLGDLAVSQETLEGGSICELKVRHL